MSYKSFSKNRHFRQLYCSRLSTCAVK